MTGSPGAILLSIRDVFAERILSGDKLFELRKSIPRDPFERVFLHVSNGGGVVGCFDVSEVHRLPPDDLWKAVGTRATTRDRFDAYFAGRSIGNAIGVANPVRFSSPVFPDELKELEPRFMAPQSFLILDKYPRLKEFLNEYREKTVNTPTISFRDIEPQHEELFVDQVHRTISHRYQDIDESYGRLLLDTHRRGRDPKGLLTNRKRVLEIGESPNTLIGFVVLTYKEGRSVKSGPMILLDGYQRSGFGPRVKSAMCTMLRAEGVRKLYCTCPASDKHIVNYLLKSRHRIEAHLVAHYRPDSDELVFGRILQQSLSRPEKPRARKSTPSALDEHALDELEASEFIRLLDPSWLPVPRAGLQRIARAALDDRADDYAEKPVKYRHLKTAERCQAILFAVPKRGNSAKLLLCAGTSHTPSIQRLFEEMEQHLKDLGKRKVFCLHPLMDSVMIRMMRKSGYRPEGILIEPYHDGVDVVCLSKFL